MRVPAPRRLDASAVRANRRPAPARRAAAIPALGFAALSALLACGSDPADPAEPLRGPVADRAASAVPQRIVSLNPSLSAIVLALGASDSLVGIDDASARALPSLGERPLVGGLFNPSLEGVVALEPDWVVLVPSVEQRDFSARLEELGVAVEAFPNDSLQAVVATIEAMGARLGPEAERRAAERTRAIEATRRAVARVAERYDSPRSLIVLQRDPLYVVGRNSFLDEMLEAVGGENTARAFDESYPRVGVEWLVEAAPQLILDSSFDAELGIEFWQRWPSLPAVANARVVSLRDPLITLPGPRLDEALLLLLRAVHGEEAERAARAVVAAASASATGVAADRAAVAADAAGVPPTARALAARETGAAPQGAPAP